MEDMQYEPPQLSSRERDIAACGSRPTNCRGLPARHHLHRVDQDDEAGIRRVAALAGGGSRMGEWSRMNKEILFGRSPSPSVHYNGSSNYLQVGCAWQRAQRRSLHPTARQFLRPHDLYFALLPLAWLRKLGHFSPLVVAYSRDLTSSLTFKTASLLKLTGTVVAVPWVNISGYLKFTRKFADGKDLNRLFPGCEDGLSTATSS
ncbi:hypothetical protein BC938DRAFT_470968 [Jimgerdemannia flammicorona]|uniref:Uncharacterized protein n=1 Tax=Jimgerdemannia flammicorona TaxID=994334 RepID=A0A433Q984_9FUNG|nr:hypothetical protein BC938DRAFT_470968 [Jimgerdemannia flammicorona]